MTRGFGSSSWWFSALCLVGVTACPIIAADRTAPAVQTPRNYCGLYAVYGAAIYEGVALDFTSLLNHKYLGCFKGSSIMELQQAADDHGLHTLTASRMTPLTLRHSDKPVILHVRSDFSAIEFDHYVLYLRYRDGRYECMDGDELRRMTEPELLALWGGSGMVVSASPVKSMSVLSSTWARHLAWLLGGAAVMAGIKFVGPRWFKRSGGAVTGWRGVAFPAGGILAASLAVALVYHRTAVAGLLAEGNLVGQVQAAHAGTFIPRISTHDARRMFDAKSVTFVDARLPYDFDAGHIEGAISIPIGTRDRDRLAAMVDISTSRPVIVYCQNNTCPYAKAVALGLIRDGYTDVWVYADGWEAWRGHRNE